MSGAAEIHQLHREANCMTKTEETMANSKEAIVEALAALLDAFNAHDLDQIMSMFAEDCILQMPRGDRPWGSRFVGKDAVRQGLAARFSGIPDVRYGDATHLVSGEVGITKWTLTGTQTNGNQVEVLGCDFYTFKEGKVIQKDWYWKIVQRS